MTDIQGNRIQKHHIEVPDDTAISFEDFDNMFHVKHFPELVQQWNLNITDEQEKKLYLFYQNLIQWNKVMNLTAITEPGDVLVKHYLDSFSLVTVFPLEKLDKGIRIMDVGTGAGFPGMPLAILFPKSKFILMDSLNKRISFLEDTIQKLKLQNVLAIHARAEELGRNKDYREQFDLVCSRAVADLRILNEYCLPFVKLGGSFVSYKTEHAAQEIDQAAASAKILGGRIEKKKELTLPETDYQRILVLIEKEKCTPRKYPRKAGIPAKEPL